MGPLSIYLPNSQELSFGLKDVLINVVLMAVVLFVIITVLYLCISEKFKKFFIIMFFIVTLILYLQGNFLTNSFDLGVLDGSLIDWTKNRNAILFNLFIYLFLFVLIMIAKNKDKRMLLHISIVSLFLTVIQVPVLIIQAFNYRPKDESTLLITKKVNLIFLKKKILSLLFLMLWMKNISWNI